MLHLQVGDRIELVSMPEDPNPIPRGTRGTVSHVNRVGRDFVQVSVKWDNGSSLMLSFPPDRVRLVLRES